MKAKYDYFKMPNCLYLVRYLDSSILCLSFISTFLPWINALLTWDRISSISPSAIKSVASLPVSRDPILSDTPKISAEESVIDRSDSSQGSP